MQLHKPFLLLQLRPEDEASDNEYEAFLKFGRVSPRDVVRIRTERTGLPDIDLDLYSGVLVGGGPFNVSDMEEHKPEAQKALEPRLESLVREVIDRDFPYLGACYGLGILTRSLSGTVSKEKFGESAGAVTIERTEEGMHDPLLSSLPTTFRAFGGHKEACQEVPEGATLLASSETCPVQMIRVKNNIYATQFHPELDTEGLVVRVHCYKHHGYFKPEDAETLVASAEKEDVRVPMQILERFTARYRRAM